jgi:hypothetical protein
LVDKKLDIKGLVEFYPDLNTEVIPSDAREALGKPVQIKMFCDASHATDLVTR